MENHTRSLVLATAGALLFCIAALLSWLLLVWKYVPVFASLFAGLNAPLPWPTRLAIEMSSLTVRLLPFLILGMFVIVPGAVVGLWLATTLLGWRRLPLVLFLVVGFMALVACGFIVFAMYLPLATVVRTMS